MKKSKKIRSLVFGTIATISLLSAICAFAGYGSFYLTIPRAQAWAITEDENGNGYITGSSASNCLVSLTGFTGITAATFYSGAWENNGTEDLVLAKSGTVMYRSDFEDYETDATVQYAFTYGQGQKMGLGVRNHSWSLNRGDVSGVVNYH